jgi:teichuronic acid biosynthesis glycosyltransferase TuaC
MKILTFTSLFPNRLKPDFGAFIYQRTAHLAARAGNFLRVLAPIPYFPSWPRTNRWSSFSKIPINESVGTLTVSHPRYPLLPGVMPLHGWLIFLGCLQAVRRLHREFGFDCIDAHYIYPDCFAAVLLAKILRIPVIVSARGTDINLFPNFITILPQIRWVLLQCSGIIAVSAALKEKMVAIGVPAEKIRVIGNGVDTHRFQWIDRDLARRRLAVPEKARMLLSVGSLVPVKSHHLLISVMAELATRYPDLLLYIVGDGPERSRLELEIRSRGLQMRIFLPGNQPNEVLPFWFSAADISCLTSSREGWPNVISESIACGTPVVATRVGGVPEIITSPDLGIMTEPTVHSIAEGIQLALRTDWDRQLLLRTAQSRTWAVVAEEVESFIASRVRSPANSGKSV